MNFIETKITYAGFAPLLESEYGIKLVGDFDGDKPQLIEIADECLTAKNGNYPTLYYFSDVNGTGYILFDYKGEQSIDKVVDRLDSKVDCQPTVCKQYVLQTSCFWNIPNNPYYAAVMGIYGMTNCVEELTGDEKNVVVWSERRWCQDYMNVPLNQYCCDGDGVPIVFDTVIDAQAYIASLMTESYTLQAHELSRPNYIVTY